MIPWSPLARGKLTRDWNASTARSATDDFGRRLYRDEDQVVVERVADIAAARGITWAQVALAWVSRHPAVAAPIVGVTQPGHIADAVASLAVELDDDEVGRLEEPYRPHDVAGFG